MKLDEFVSNQSYLFFIPRNEDVKFHPLTPEYHFFARHYVEQERQFVPCIGEKNNCPLCPDDRLNKAYVNYIKLENGDIVLAALPYSVPQAIREMKEQQPDLFENDVPKFFVNVFKSGEGQGTKYTVTKDVEDNSTVDLSQYQDIKEYIEQEKNKIKGSNVEQDGVDIKMKDEGIPVNNIPF